MSGIDVVVNNSIFRKDFPSILAMNRQHAVLIPARLLFDAVGYVAGQVVARNTTSGIYQKYVASGPSGTGTAVGVLIDDLLDAPSGANVLQQVIVKGEVFQAALTSLDSQAITDLKARSITTGGGVQILMF